MPVVVYLNSREDNRIFSRANRVRLDRNDKRVNEECLGERITGAEDKCLVLV